MSGVISLLGGQIGVIAVLGAIAAILTIWQVFYGNKDKIKKLLKPTTFTSENLYHRYEKAIDQIWIQLTTWPVYSEYEDCLINSKARKIYIIGPIENDQFYKLPGVLWRLKIKDVIEKDPNRKMFLYHISAVPSIAKFILIDTAFFSSCGTKKSSTIYKEISTFQNEIPTDILLKEIYNNGEDALLKVYKMIEDQLTLHENIPIKLLISRIISQYRASCTENIRDIRRAHKKLSDNDLNKLLEDTIPLLVSYVKNNYGIKTVIILDDGKNIKKVGLLPVYDTRKTFRDVIESLKSRRVAPIGNLPQMRIVINGICNVNCIYCPYGNESYSLSQAHLEPEDLNDILNKSYDLGFTEFAITGGEPRLHPNFIDILEVIKGFLKDNTDSSIIINTNAIDTRRCFTFEQLLSELKDYKNRVVFKISLDGLKSKIVTEDKENPNYLEFLKRYPKIDHSENIIKNIEKALDQEYKIGLNFVLTKSNQKFLKTTLLYFHDMYKNQNKKYPSLYFKILDLNWYHDIGNRHNEPSSYQFWKNQYKSPLEYYYEENLQNIFGVPKDTLNLNFGIPMVEVNNSFRIKIKDSSLGTHYHKKNHCSSCLFYIKNLCQEGIYQPWITPEGTLKMCYHRPDIIKSILGSDNVIEHPEILDEFKNLLGELEYVQIKQRT